MRIVAMELGVLRTNCYLVMDENSKEAVLIDPADEADKIECRLQKEEVKLKYILLTHGHFDHIYAAAKVAAMYHAPVCCGEAEAELLESEIMNESASFRREVSLVADRLLKDKEQIFIGDSVLTVLATPGHTVGGVCYYAKDQGILFSGDTLFFESIGRSDFHTGNERLLLQSIRERLFSLPEQTEVYPGHGPKTSIGYEKKNNPYVPA